MPESLLNRQLSLDFFKNQIGEHVARQIHKITLCGNDGDPIYCRDLMDIVQWFKSLNPKLQIVLITNGSYKPIHWWQQLGHILTVDDEVHWSIDGWDQESNAKYRVSCDWDSILHGIESFQTTNNLT